MRPIYPLRRRVELLTLACDLMGTPRTPEQRERLRRLIDRLARARQRFMRAAGHG